LKQTAKNIDDPEKHMFDQTRSSPESVSLQTADIGHAKQVAGRIQQELQMLLRERSAISKRIGLMKRTLVGLAEISGLDVANRGRRTASDEPPAPRRTCRSRSGLTETCRRTLMGLSQPTTTRQLYERIEQQDPSLFARNKHPMESLAVVLKRLVSYGDVLDVAGAGDGRTWLWAEVDRQSARGDEHPSSSALVRSEARKELSVAGAEA
jgi:hypothetical protein